MSDFLGIDLIAGLDEDKSIGQINRAIGRIQTSSDLNKLEIKMDKKALDTIKEFNREIKKLSQEAEKSGRSIRRAVLVRGDGNLSKSIEEATKKTKELAREQDRRSKQNQKNLRDEGEAFRKYIDRFENGKKVSSTVEEADRDRIQVSRKTVGSDGTVTGSISYDEGKERKIQEKRNEQLLKERERILNEIEKIRRTGYGKESQLRLFEEKTASEDLKTLQGLQKEVRNYSTEVGQFSKRKVDLQDTLNHFDRLHKKGSLQLPKKNFLTDIRDNLKSADTVKDLDRVAKKINQLDGLFKTRQRGMESIDSLRVDGVLPARDLTDARESMRKAETLRQAQLVSDHIKTLQQQNNAIKTNNKELEREANKRQQLIARLSRMDMRFGELADLKMMSRMQSNIMQAGARDFDGISRNIQDQERYLSNLQKIRDVQRRHNEDVYKMSLRLAGTPPQELVEEQRRITEGYRNLSPHMRNLDGEIKNLQSSQRVLNAEMMKADEGVARFVRQLASAIVRVPIYAATITALYTPMRMFRDAISQSIEIDSQMTVLERVSNGTIKMNDALEDSVEIAGKLGNVIHEVNDGLIAFARQGFRGDDLSRMTEYATVMSNVSDLSVDEAASSLTAAMKGFNIEAEESIHIVNALNEVDKFCVPHTSNSMRKSRICWKPVVQSSVGMLFRKLCDISNNLKNMVAISRDSPKLVVIY